MQYKNKQVEIFHYFFSKYGKTLMIGIFFSISVLTTIWYFWNIYQHNALYKASILYERLINELNNNKMSTLENVVKFANENNNCYGALASLALAKQYIDINEMEKASEQLRNGLKNTNDLNLQAIMNLRLARIQLQQGKVDNVLKTLNHIKAKGWKMISEDIRAEALLSKGDKLGALDIWRTAINSEESLELRKIMRIKMNNLEN